MIRVECRGYSACGTMLCNQLNDAIAKMAPERRVVSVSVVQHERGCQHEDPSVLVYFVIEENK